MSNRFFTLFANCIIVKGKNRSIICDIQNNQFELVPNDLYRIFSHSNCLDLYKLKKTINNEDFKTVIEYIDFLYNKGFGIWSDRIFDGLTPLNTKWETFSHITNAMIEDGNWSVSKYNEINDSLNKFNCQSIEIRFTEQKTISELAKILSVFNNSKIRSISLYIVYHNSFTNKSIDLFTKHNSRLHSISIYNCPTNSNLNIKNHLMRLFCFHSDIKKRKSCGLVSSKFFVVNILHFSESKNYNSCLNKKIAIDSDGYIKNCPSMTKSFGNINKNSLEDALNHKDFKKYWNITKDEIKVCKDCEFRHICTDCRAYIENPSDVYSKPLKCGYDPYTNTWEDWSANPLKQKAIEHYGMQNLIKK